MGNTKHYEILHKGYEVWNKWREDNPETIPDLSSECLFSANLEKVNLSYANLSKGSLHRVPFDLTNLTGANLTGADLTNARFSYAIITDANFDRSIMRATIFSGVDLSKAKGLDTVVHRGNSVIFDDCFRRATGPISEKFLRESGNWSGYIGFERATVSQVELYPKSGAKHIPSGEKFGFHSCFISYSHEDRNFAFGLYNALTLRGISCWLDEHNLLPGQNIHESIKRAIDSQDKVLLCCSKASLTSWWVDNEINIAFAKEQELWKARAEEKTVLIPLNLDGYMFSKEWNSGKSEPLKSRVAADFTGWERDSDKFEEQVKRLVEALNKIS